MNKELKKMRLNQYNEADLFLHFWNGHTDKADNGYATFYEIIFNERHPKSILEIGIRSGGSLMAWRTLFPDARVVGVDIIPPSPRRIQQYKKMNIEWYVCDATKMSMFDYIGNKPFDLIVDDGSHFYKHQRESFDILRDSFNHYYVIEDVRWRHDETVNHIESYGYEVERFPCEFQPTATMNKHFLETNEGDFISPDGHKISGAYNPNGDFVTTPMEFWMIRQLT